MFRPTFYRIWKKKSVEEFSAAPYVATFVNCGLWVLYGIPLVHPHSILVVTINGTGLAIEVLYLMLFLLHSDQKKRMKVFLIIVVEIIFLASLAILVLTLFHTHKKRSTIVGSICMVANIFMYASPLAVMVNILFSPFQFIFIRKSMFILLFFRFMLLLCHSFSSDLSYYVSICFFSMFILASFILYFLKYVLKYFFYPRIY